MIVSDGTGEVTSQSLIFKSNGGANLKLIVDDKGNIGTTQA